MHPSRVMVPRELQTKPRTQLGVMWSHGCPNWLLETDTKVFEKHFSFLLFAPSKSLFQNNFLFAKLTVRAKTHSEIFLKSKFFSKNIFVNHFPFVKPTVRAKAHSEVFLKTNFLQKHF